MLGIEKKKTRKKTGVRKSDEHREKIFFYFLFFFNCLLFIPCGWFVYFRSTSMRLTHWRAVDWPVNQM
jgi:hypothetical protein